MELDGTTFICNICGSRNEYARMKMHREMLNCEQCGANARFRALVYGISESLNLPKAPLVDIPPNKGLKGIGFSDSEIYASHLARVFDFQNTFFHTDPRLDIMNSDQVRRFGTFDFVVCSEVLEHVPPPAIKAFENLRMLVKAGGALILSVPTLEGYETIEHFPHLNEWSHTRIGDEFALLNKRSDGLVETHQRLSFHGGPGEVLEMRIYGEEDLKGRLRHVGFSDIQSIEPTRPDIGVVWRLGIESPLHRDRRSMGHIMICR